MNERPVYFGPGGGLLGVLTSPTNRSSGAPAVIFLNAGLLHRVGPNRMHVDLARRLAEAGHACLRFDMSGVGDSELLDTELLYIERSVHDVVAAMDAMEGMAGTDRFVLMGLCTGAFNAFRAALRDERVAGCVLMDGYAYPTARSRFRHYRTRVFQLDKWRRYVKRRLGLGGESSREPEDDMVVFENEVVPRERFGAELSSLLERGTRLLLVYTRLGPLPFNYERQMHDAFPDLEFDPNVRVRYYADADHTFTIRPHRLRLYEDVMAWMSESFSPAEVAREA